MQELKDLEVIVVLSALPRNKRGAFPNVERGLYYGGQVRMEAAAKVFLLRPDALYVAVGGLDADGGQSKADDMAGFLSARCPGIKVLSVGSLPCTKHNLVALFNKAGLLLKGKKVGLLTNQYHMPRALGWWEKLVREGYPDMPSEPVPIIAEYLEGENELEQNPSALGKRMILELQGIRDIQQNTYYDSCYGKFDDYRQALQKESSVLLTKGELSGLTGADGN